MSNKFTEEQYHKIVEIADEYQSHSAFGIIGDVTQKSIGAEVYESELCVEIDFYENAKEIMAIANPLTREWAHDQFVEKEPEFHFILKNMYDSDDWRYHLVRNRSDAIILFRFSEEKYDRPKFKESEIKAWGFNPEMFDKEEVD